MGVQSMIVVGVDLQKQANNSDNNNMYVETATVVALLTLAVLIGGSWEWDVKHDIVCDYCKTFVEDYDKNCAWGKSHACIAAQGVCFAAKYVDEKG